MKKLLLGILILFACSCSESMSDSCKIDQINKLIEIEELKSKSLQLNLDLEFQSYSQIFISEQNKLNTINNTINDIFKKLDKNTPIKEDVIKLRSLLKPEYIIPAQSKRLEDWQENQKIYSDIFSNRLFVLELVDLKNTYCQSLLSSLHERDFKFTAIKPCFIRRENGRNISYELMIGADDGRISNKFVIKKIYRNDILLQTLDTTMFNVNDDNVLNLNKLSFGTYSIVLEAKVVGPGGELMLPLEIEHIQK